MSRRFTAPGLASPAAVASPASVASLATIASPASVASLAAVASLALLTASLGAQSQARLAELRDGKLQLPFLKNADWVLRFAGAKAEAKKSGKPIFAYFTRSDERCMNSISLECGVLAEEGFKAFSEKVVPFCHITTRVKTDPDQGLFEAKGGVTFPRMLFMDATGKVLYVVKGETLADVQKGLDELTELAALRDRVAQGDRKAKFPLVEKLLFLQHIDFPTAKKELRRLPRLTKAQKERIAPYLLRAEVLHLAARTKNSQKARARTGEVFLRMRRAGRIPIGDAVMPFWRHIMDYAELRKHPDVYEDALDSLKQAFSDMDFREEDRTLRRLKSGTV